MHAVHVQTIMAARVISAVVNPAAWASYARLMQLCCSMFVAGPNNVGVLVIVRQKGSCGCWCLKLKR